MFGDCRVRALDFPPMAPWWWVHAAVLAAAYLLGSIPFSFLVARREGVDVRAVGSGNVGATNVMRNVGRAAGLLAFVLDFAKGSAATWLARATVGGFVFPSVAAVVAVLGHMHPVWLRFRGGKGVATGAGAFLPIAPVPTVCALTLFAIVTAATRYVSVGSIAASASLDIEQFGTSQIGVNGQLFGRRHPVLERQTTAGGVRRRHGEQ